MELVLLENSYTAGFKLMVGVCLMGAVCGMLVSESLAAGLAQPPQEGVRNQLPGTGEAVESVSLACHRRMPRDMLGMPASNILHVRKPYNCMVEIAALTGAGVMLCLI